MPKRQKELIICAIFIALAPLLVGCHGWGEALGISTSLHNATDFFVKGFFAVYLDLNILIPSYVDLSYHYILIP